MPSNNVRPRTCRQCGATFNGGPRAWYCPSCRKEREKMRAAGYWKNGVSRPIGSSDLCEKCGQPYIVASGLQRYCESCRNDAVKEIDRQQGLEWYHKNADTYNSVRKIKRRKNQICVICGKEFPCDGTCRNTCSDDCRKVQRREWQRKAECKRKDKKQK